MADKNVIVNDNHRLYMDPVYGLHLPIAEDLAADGVVTASAIVVHAGETVKAPADDIDALRAAGVLRGQ